MRNHLRRHSRLVGLLVVASAIFAPKLRGQAPSFSSTAEYQSMLAALHRQPILPSRISAGTLRATAVPPADLKVRETAGALLLETDSWRLEIAKRAWRMTLENKRTGVAWQLAPITWTRRAGETNAVALRLAEVQRIEKDGSAWRMHVKIEGSSAAAALEVAVLSPTVIRLSVRAPQLGDDAAMKLNFTGAGPFFGLGERFAREKLDGLKTTLRPEDLLGKPGHNWTYIPVPFLLTPRGMGLYLDTARVTTFDLGRAAQQQFSVQINGPSTDCYFFLDSGPLGILRNYTALTGRSPLLPPWAFGVWICSYQGPHKVLAEARQLRRERIPASALWVFDVMGKGQSMGWPLWWTGYYPKPRELTNQLHQLGFRVLTYCYPFVRQVLNPYNLPNPSFEEGVRNGLFVLNAAGQPDGPAFEPYIDANLDFTNPRAVDWWESFLRQVLVDDNFDGWMEDFGEWVNAGDSFAAGVKGDDMENLNPLFYHKITNEISRRFKPGVVEFDRSGYAGSQGYTPVVWGGDQPPNWDQQRGLPSLIPAGITAGLSGFSVWGPDIDGNGYSKELWIRWVEFGALTPIMRTHLWDKPYGAVNLWYDSQTIENFRRYAGLHVSLFPYLYSYAYKAHQTGLPIIRHPMLEYPNDLAAYSADGEYLLGAQLLVAPVLKQGAITRSLYLPQGSWVNYWTGEIIAGGRRATVPAPLDTIPILVRAGSIIPLISPNTQTLAADASGGNYDPLAHRLIWRVFPARGTASSSFALYDGAVATARQDLSRITVQVANSPAIRHVEIILPDVLRPREVTLGSKHFSKLNDADYQARQTGWWPDPKDGTLRVLFSARDFELSVVR